MAAGDERAASAPPVAGTPWSLRQRLKFIRNAIAMAFVCPMLLPFAMSYVHVAAGTRLLGDVTVGDNFREEL